MKDYTKLYIIIFWTSLISILIWVILKIAGVINTPLIIEMFPIISAIFGAGAFFQMILDMRNRLNKLENKTDNGFKMVDYEMANLDKRCVIIESKL